MSLQWNDCHWENSTSVCIPILSLVSLWTPHILQSTLFSGIENSWEAQSEALGNCVLCKDNQNSH